MIHLFDPTELDTYRFRGVKVMLVHEGEPIDFETRPRFTDSEAAAGHFRRYLNPDELDREVIVVALLDARHRLIEYSTAHVGCLTSSLVHPREILKPAILAGAAGFAMCHNHPSGDPEPSAEDMALTRRMKAAGDLMGIELVDHIVLGHGDRFVSLSARGAL